MEAFANFFSGAPAFIRRSDFPKDFAFGAATAAFQIEGGHDKGGRGASIWDTFAKKHDLFKPYTEDAVNHYEKFEEDVELMKQIGFDAYRFSISWPRILPTGKIESRNQHGIDYYKKLLKRLRDNGIEPYVTLFHWDLPLALQEEYNGFLDRRVADDFAVYADVCFQEFIEYVDHWITMNEPFTFAYSAHVINAHAPGLGTVHEQLFDPGTNDGKQTAKAGDDKKVNNDEEEEDDGGSMFHPSRSTIHEKAQRKKIMVFKPVTDWASEAEFLDEFSYPYIVTHNQLLAHAKAVQIFREKYQKRWNLWKKKQIGITLVSMWFEPRNPDNEKDKAAALRALDFFIGWYLDPLVKGDYPKSMREYVKREHLPEMTSGDRKLIQGSYDFIGVNYYTARLVAHQEPKKKHQKIGRNYVTDQHLMYYETRKSKTGEEVPIGTDKGASAWLISYPKGIRDLMLYIKNNYNNPVIYITENGIDDLDDESSRLWSSFFDQKRVTHIHDHLTYLLEAIREGVKVKGYFAWSLLDNFEWNNGFHARFGLVYVDYKTGNRHPKLSAAWLKHFLIASGNENGNGNGKGKETSQLLVLESKLRNQESQIRDLNDQIRALTVKLDALPSTTEIDFNSPRNRINIGKILVSSCQIPVVQEAIGKGLLRWASAEGSRLWDLAHWESLLDTSKHPYYGGGINLQAAIVKHPNIHGVDITIPTTVEDYEFFKTRNSQNNNEIYNSGWNTWECCGYF